VPDVVADTSVIQYLFQIGLLDLLFTLYPRISIPEAVANELAEGRKHGVELPDDDAMARFEVLSVDVPNFPQMVKALGTENAKFYHSRLPIRVAWSYLTTRSRENTLVVSGCGLQGRSASYSRPNNLACWLS
jgi:hypothetical protein